MEEKILEEVRKLNDVTPAPGSGDILERIIHALGDMGTYQRCLFAAMMPFAVFLVFVYCVQMFIAATPQEHWCRVPELQHLDVVLRRNLSIPGAVNGPDWDRCAVYDANWTEVLETMAPPIGSNTTPCRHGWEFLYNDIPYPTVVSEREWVCEHAGNAPFSQSTFFLGSLIGCALFGWIGDKYGRIPAFIGANLIGCIGSIATVFTTAVWDFTIARFFVGMANDACSMILYILVLEYVGPQHRTWVSNMSIALGCGGGSLMLVGLALWLLDWRKLVLATSLPMLIVVVAPWLAPESVRWLVSKEKVDKAIGMLKRFEKINRKKIPDDLMGQFMIVSTEQNSADESLRAVFKNPPLRNALFLLIIISMVASIAIDAILRMSESIGTNFFLTFALSSFAEIPALALVTLVLDRWGRRSLIMGTMMTAGIISLLCAFTSKGLLQTVLAVAMRFFINMTVAVQIQLTAELIPTGARASGNALVHVTVFIAIMFSPYIVYSGRYWASLPLLIVGVMSLAAGACAVYLPETKGKPMPQTIVEAEKLIRDGTLWRTRDVSRNFNAEYDRVHVEIRKRPLAAIL